MNIPTGLWVFDLLDRERWPQKATRKEQAGKGKETTEEDPEDPEEQGRWLRSEEPVAMKIHLSLRMESPIGEQPAAALIRPRDRLG